MDNEDSLVDEPVIIVEFAPTAGVRGVSLTPADIAQESAKALDKAMLTIRQMAKKTMDTIDTLSNKPSEVELEFGIKLNTEAGAIIAKTAGEASLKVKLLWERKDSNNESDSKSA
ncbi:MAG TPA: CU044_2847 family protein [Leptolyngbyaceae cyanobacterium]